jgi:NAD(P)H-hydrate repair Nnr-like enzyme with NAD(P)H-hydrate dehydratase domain
VNDDLPDYDLTIALGAWKFAHFLMPASAKLGALRLVEIGIESVADAANVIARPALGAPAADSHKYRRGLLGVVGGEMPGASVLACIAAQGAGAGYVKLLCGPSVSSGRAELWAEPSENPDLGPDFSHPTPARAEPVEARALPWDLVADSNPLTEALVDSRFNAILIGPGLGRDADARNRLSAALSGRIPTVADADALILLQPSDSAPTIATPHEGEFAALEAAFGLGAATSKPDRARALARASGMIVVAKGPDTVIAAPDGRLALAQRASAWLSTAGTGVVLAGTIASRLATGTDPFEAACQGVWLHAEAARLCPAPFTAGDLAHAVPGAYRAAQ